MNPVTPRYSEGSGWLIEQTMKKYYVYIMTNRTRTLYIGMTNDLERRVMKHKQKLVPGFTSKYNITMLVWYQDFDDVEQAISAEKTIKAWRREKKVALIEEMNAEWRDLAAEW
jgi:putative endonuclease